MPAAARVTAEDFPASEPEVRWPELIGGELVADVPIRRHAVRSPLPPGFPLAPGAVFR